MLLVGSLILDDNLFVIGGQNESEAKPFRVPQFANPTVALESPV